MEPNLQLINEQQELNTWVALMSDEWGARLH